MKSFFLIFLTLSVYFCLAFAEYQCPGTYKTSDGTYIFNSQNSFTSGYADNLEAYYYSCGNINNGDVSCSNSSATVEQTGCLIDYNSFGYFQLGATSTLKISPVDGGVSFSYSNGFGPGCSSVSTNIITQCRSYGYTPEFRSLSYKFINSSGTFDKRDENVVYGECQVTIIQEGKMGCPYLGLQQADKTFLSDLYNQFGAQMRWSKSADPCAWEGITCHNRFMYHEYPNGTETLSGSVDYVQRVSLSNKKISGSIPSSIANLEYISHIDLSQNLLIGTIPKGWNASLQTDLRYVNFHSNKLTGSIPASLINFLSDGDEENFQLILSKNQLTGSIFTEPLDNCLENLGSFIVSDNQLSGTLPQSLDGDDCYWEFYYGATFVLSNNKFTGPIPKWICKIKEYEYYDYYDDDDNAGAIVRLDGNSFDKPGPSCCGSSVTCF